jgi:hypothetical protein
MHYLTYLRGTRYKKFHVYRPFFVVGAHYLFLRPYLRNQVVNSLV